ncbi:MAG TPA: hypothetical protein PLM07_06700 [Candidatus Rifleibacterium sp.]|nr:hypothetical protein [Candidatus Rifleibacterium sp.]HPT45570.1 hypothetical protein [Candidatus Rifleibacterium sp.]
MGRLKRKFTVEELKKANSAGFHGGNFTEMAAYLNVTRRTLFNWLKDESFAAAIQAGKRRRERQGWREMGFDADETENTFKELDQMLESVKADDFGKPLQAKPGFHLEYERIELENGGVKEIWRLIPDELPSLKDMQRGMRRINGLYQF